MSNILNVNVHWRSVPLCHKAAILSRVMTIQQLSVDPALIEIAENRTSKMSFLPVHFYYVSQLYKLLI